MLRSLHLGQDIYQSRGGVESNLVLGLTGTDPQGDCQMSFSGAGIASQDNIFFVFNVLPPREGEDFGLVKVWILRKIKAVQSLLQGKTSCIDQPSVYSGLTRPRVRSFKATFTPK